MDAKLILIPREMQLFLIGYLVIEICEIFTIGGFPLDGAVRRVRAFPPNLLGYSNIGYRHFPLYT
jgi:hypothetical protein